MDLQVGDPVMHWMHGFGHVIGIEERTIAGSKTQYYAISIRDLTVWVPDDNNLGFRLRRPTTKRGFKELFAILNGDGKPLPIDRQERRLWLLDLLKDGQAASLCHALRDLATYQQEHSINYNDENLMKRLRESLLGEWAYALAVPMDKAEKELRGMLGVEALRG
jgi:RNA polymerase-interacting CarD/CdnL/TRCF family regulator